MRQITAYLALAFISLSSIAQADNWGHWRGPTGNSVAFNASPPIEWSTTKNVKWKVDLSGLENSSPVVWGNQVFVTNAVPVKAGKGDELPTFEFKLFSYNRKNGKLLWEQTATVAQPHQTTHSTSGFASASPCTDGEHVYAHFGSRGLYCYTMNGKLVWKRDDFGKMDTLNNFGEGSSPTIEGNKIIVPWDHQGPSALHVLNKRTGKTIWKVDRDEPTSWATPLVVEHAGQKQIIVNGQNFARSYDLESGKELWRCSGQTVRPITTPVFDGKLVYIGSGYGASFVGAFRLDGKGDIQGTDHVVWTKASKERLYTDMASPVLISGRLYFHKGKNAPLSCVEAATGEEHYLAKRISGLGNNQVYASPVAAGGNIYLTDVTGTTVVIKDSTELEILATNKLDEFVGGTPAPVDNELFIRGKQHLYCISASK